MGEHDPAADLVAALSALSDPKKDGHVQAGQRRYRYLELPDLLAEVRTTFGTHHWAIMQIPDVVDGHVIITNLWIHATGEKITHPPFALPCGRSPQEIGSAITYARRYSLASLVGLAGSDDDDGRAAAQHRRQDDRDRYGQTRPVQRGHTTPDDPTNQPWQQPPEEPPQTPAADGPTPPRPPALSTHQQTEHPYEGHQAHQHGASDKSLKMMWSLIRKTGMGDAKTRQWVAEFLGIDLDWSSKALSQAQVSKVIEQLMSEPSADQEDTPDE